MLICDFRTCLLYGGAFNWPPVLLVFMCLAGVTLSQTYVDCLAAQKHVLLQPVSCSFSVSEGLKADFVFTACVVSARLQVIHLQ